ncbi:MAG: hypothetical protein AAGA62_14050, partial [Bacteroidota bacterium]
MPTFSFDKRAHRAGIQVLFWSLINGALFSLSLLLPFGNPFGWRILWIFLVSAAIIYLNTYYLFPYFF